jgi:hypothetical protein
MNKKYALSFTPGERGRIQDTAITRAASNTIPKRAHLLLLAGESAGKPVRQEETPMR